MDMKELVESIARETGDTHTVLGQHQNDAVFYMLVGVVGTDRKYYVSCRASPPYTQELVNRAVHQMRTNAL